MTKRDKAGHNTVADSLRELIRKEDNRRPVQKLFGLTVEPEVSPTLASLLLAIDQVQQGSLRLVSGIDHP
ncbi:MULTISPECIES: hypothetical protein [unclassified Mesorhizobium]|uniref:hypothetical protein n=1 Tax=unclassified Mesorhizobium TaxID=325217 RepID=UPI000FCB94D6|nr:MULTISPECIES: hypothetical protein [unclassified Mesorhizobium]RUX98104.1 hypothetical protein EN993_01395 [Mesorhizobium sp. M7D.F.Ca.US.004.01.2.1]RVA37241.1 hypothetical protein EN935_00340 [Mesorhizobium sp. M7D.F.Ca.US.004.03.1.1]